MIHLYDKITRKSLGHITEQQLQFLIDHLEEESSDDQDYYINRVTLEIFGQAGADRSLVDLLWDALGDRSEMEICWEHE